MWPPAKVGMFGHVSSFPSWADCLKDEENVGDWPLADFMRLYQILKRSGQWLLEFTLATLLVLPLKLTWWDLSINVKADAIILQKCDRLTQENPLWHHILIFHYGKVVWYKSLWYKLKVCARMCRTVVPYVQDDADERVSHVWRTGINAWKLGICKDALFHYLNNMWKTLC